LRTNNDIYAGTRIIPYLRLLATERAPTAEHASVRFTVWRASRQITMTRGGTRVAKYAIYGEND